MKKIENVIGLIAFIALAVVLFLGLLFKQEREVKERREALQTSSEKNLEVVIGDYNDYEDKGDFFYITDPETGVEYLLLKRKSISDSPYIGLGPRYKSDGDIYINPDFAKTMEPESVTELVTE